MSDSSAGLVYAYDRFNKPSASFTYGSGADSGSCGGGGWRNGAGPATRETEIEGRSYQIICARAAGAGVDSSAEVGGGGGGAGNGGGDGIRSGASGGGGSEHESGSSDGLGDSTSVADITECFECIDDVSGVASPGGRFLAADAVGRSFALWAWRWGVRGELEPS